MNEKKIGVIHIETDEIKYTEDVRKGLEVAPDSFLDLLEGNNFGKMLIKIS